jgi:hypothetical protein
MLDERRIREVVDAVAERLDGHWLLLGGALVALWLEPRRVTEDVDLVGLGGTQGERFALLELAAELGLPVEALNSAADYFVRRIDGWEAEIEPFKDGARGRVFRPTPTLFVLLKAARLSEQDLSDCAAAVARARAEGLRLDVARLKAALAALPPSGDANQGERRVRLRRLLDA